jgi:hypothetical protein
MCFERGFAKRRTGAMVKISASIRNFDSRSGGIEAHFQSLGALADAGEEARGQT